MREAITEAIRVAISGTQRTLDTIRELSHLDAAQTPSDASVSSSYLMRAAIMWSSVVISGEVAIMAIMGRFRRSYSGMASTTSTSFFFLFPPFKASTSAFFFASASAAGAAFLGPIAPVIRILRACWISLAFDWPNVEDVGSFAARIMRSKS